MKKKKTSLESEFWTTKGIENPFDLIHAFFDYSNLETYKKTLGEAFCMYIKGKFSVSIIRSRFLFFTKLYGLSLKHAIFYKV